MINKFLLSFIFSLFLSFNVLSCYRQALNQPEQTEQPEQVNIDKAEIIIKEIANVIEKSEEELKQEIDIVEFAKAIENALKDSKSDVSEAKKFKDMIFSSEKIKEIQKQVLENLKSETDTKKTKKAEHKVSETIKNFNQTAKFSEMITMFLSYENAKKENKDLDKLEKASQLAKELLIETENTQQYITRVTNATDADEISNYAEASEENRCKAEEIRDKILSIFGFKPKETSSSQNCKNRKNKRKK